MKQQEVTERIMRVLIKNDLVDPENYDAIFPFIQQAYGAGYDQGRTFREHRRAVVQLSLDGKKLEVHESLVIAAKKCRTGRCDIGKVCRGKRKSAGGYKWIYLDEFKSELHDTT